jgi:2-oxoglutarate ferredoxin oxidoreductase subunit beta
MSDSSKPADGQDPLRVIPTETAPEGACRKKGNFEPALTLMGEHDLCPGCGEPVALRQILDSIEALGQAQTAIGTIGIGCYTALTSLMDIDLIQALHGRAPSVATGAKRMRPDSLVFTLQGDGDMVNEGLQEVIHTAARGENVTCILLNNGVFGETGGHMTATTVLGQRTKNSIDGRTAEEHGYPILIGDLLSRLQGTTYCARASVHDAKGVHRARRFIDRAFESQLKGQGFSFVEILTMCPTGWFIPTAEGPDYLDQELGAIHEVGEMKKDGVLIESAH